MTVFNVLLLQAHLDEVSVIKILLMRKTHPID